MGMVRRKGRGSGRNITLYVTKKPREEKTNKHESDDMLVNYDFIICHDMYANLLQCEFFFLVVLFRNAHTKPLKKSVIVEKKPK